MARNLSPAVFVHKDLADTTHVFLRQDAVRRPLDPPYSGPYKDLDRIKKTLLIAMNGQVTVSTDSVNPAYILMQTDESTVDTWAPPEHTTQLAP